MFGLKSNQTRTGSPTPSSVNSIWIGPNATNNIVTLTSTASWAGYERSTNTYFNTHFGQVFADLKNDVETTILQLGPRPHYNDPRINPVTNLPIIGSRMYRQVEKTPEQIADPNFDENTLELVPSEQTKLDKNQDTYDKASIVRKTDFKDLRQHDTDALNLLQHFIGASAMTEIKISPDYKAWEQLPFTCIARALHFRRVAKAIFSKGNASEAVDVASDFFKLHQEADEDHPRAFFERVKDAKPHFINQYEDRANPGYIKIVHVEHAILYGGLSKTSANRAGIRDHLAKYPTDALDRPSELIDAVQKAHKSGLYTDDTSTQSSAFLAHSTATTIKVIVGDPKKPYCSKCFKLSGGTVCYNNHTASMCSRTAAFTFSKGNSRSSSPSKAKTSTKPPGPLHANVSATPTAFAQADFRTKADLQTTREIYTKAIHDDIPPAGIPLSDCYAFISLNFPKDLN